MDGISLGIKSDSDLHAEALQAIVAAEQASKPAMTSLAALVKKSYEDAKNHRQTIGLDDRMVESRRLKSGEYNPTDSARIALTGGSQMFFNITAPKCEAFVAWMQDVFSPVGEKVWDLSPTPIPSLPEGDAQSIVEQVVQVFSATQAGTVDPQQIKEYTQQLYDATIKRMRDDAQRRVDRMAQKIEDQTQEGGFMSALSAFIEDLSIYPSAILKGPVMRKKRRLKWENGSVTVAKETIPTWDVVDPFDFFPCPNAKCVDEGYVCERITYDKSALSLMKGEPGWKDEAIDAVTGMSQTQNVSTLNSGGILDDSEMSRLENRDTTHNSGMSDNAVEAIEFWGSVPGYTLREWGMGEKEIPDKFAYYEVNAIMIGDMVVRSIINPDPLGRRPYYVTSYSKNKNSLWGVKSLPEKMVDVQQGVNGAQRTLMNNLAIASGPQVAADVSVIPANQMADLHKLYPWKVWAYDGSKVTGSGRDPVRFFQPSSNSNELIEVTKYFEDKADDRTLIPRYVAGDGTAGGAGATASGLSMLMTAAARGIKRIIRNIDLDVIRPAIERIYVWNMMTLEDDELKGDVQIVPKGTLAALVREQTQLRRQEFLNNTASSPLAQQIMGIRGYANLLREIAKGLDMPVDKLVPSEEEVDALVHNIQASENAQLSENANGQGEGNTGSHIQSVQQQRNTQR